MSKLRLKANGVIMDTPVSDLEDMRTYDNAGVIVVSAKKGRKNVNRVMRFYFDGPGEGQTGGELVEAVKKCLDECIRKEVFPPPKRGKYVEPEIKEFAYIGIKERAHGKFGFSYEYAELFIEEYVRLLNKYNDDGTLDPENNYDVWNTKKLSCGDVLRGLIVVDPYYGACSGTAEKPVFDKAKMKDLFGFDPTDPEDRLNAGPNEYM